MKRIWLFRVVVALFGPALLVSTELFLHLWPGLASPPLVVRLTERQGKTVRLVNPLYSQIFFSQRYEGKLIGSGRMIPRPFVEPAPAPPFRIVFVGASTVQGFPHPHRLAAASFLEAMLQDAWPQRHIQVFNLGITSIASFAVARTLTDAMVLKPDLVVVYSGHNEFYGIYGVDGRSTRLSNWLHYHLLQLRTARLLSRLIDSVRGTEITSASLLQIMAERGEVPLDSPRRGYAVDHLRANLQEMISVCRQNGVALIFCTLVSNESGFAPAAAAPPRLEGEQLQQWQTWIDRAKAFLVEAEATPATADAAFDILDKAVALTPEHAWLWYLRGRALAAMGRSQEAFKAFRRARGLDTMPWRAPAAHNEVIRMVAVENEVPVADVETAFVQTAPPQGIGWELMADHVHPSVRGQALLARTILTTLKELPAVGSLLMDRVGSDAEYQALLGDLPVERVGLYQAMAELFSAPPMDRYNAHNARFFQQLVTTDWQRLSLPEKRGAKMWTTHRYKVPLVLDVGDQFFAAQDFAQARTYYQVSRREAPFTTRGDLWAAVQWAWATRLLGEEFTPEQEQELRIALERMEFLLQTLDPAVSPAFPNFIRGELLYFLGEYELALPYLENSFQDGNFRRKVINTLFPALAAGLIHAGRLEEARRLARVVSGETGGDPYFIQLVETLYQGGEIVPSR